MRHAIAFAAFLAVLAPGLAHANSGQITLDTAGEFQSNAVAYTCGTEAPISVTYVNAAPNFLAIVPVAGEPENLVFASVLSGSGSRYAAGKWVWWSAGNTASLYDTTQGDNAAPILTCTQTGSP